MTTLEITLGLAAVILPVLTYFAGLERQRNRDQKVSQDEATRSRDEIIESVVRAYLEADRSKFPTDIHRFLAAGALRLRNQEEILTACSLIEAYNQPSPFIVLSIYVLDYIPAERSMDFLKWFGDIHLTSAKPFFNPTVFRDFIQRFLEES